MRNLHVVTVLRTLFLAVIFTSAVHATGTGDVKMYPIEGSKKAKVFVTLPQRTDVVLAVQSKDGTANFYSEQIPGSNKYAKVYDFSHLEDGVYKLIAKGEIMAIEKNFEVTSSEVKLIDESRKYLPLFIEKESKLMINFLNEDLSTINVRFTDGNQSFFEENIQPEINFKKVYNIASLPTGSYVVYLENGENKYSHYFSVR